MKKTILFLLAIIMVFTLASCKTKTPVDDENNVGNNNGIEDNNGVGENPDDEIRTVKLYFANEKYIITGDGSLDSIIAIEREVDVKEKSIAEVILEELKNVPDDEQLTTMVEKVKVLSVETTDKTAYINLSGENLHGSSMEESLILQQIVYSLTELEEVDQVQFLVDGSKRESLMGHISIEEPLKGLDMK